MGANFFSQEGRVTYNNELNSDGAGSGRICLWLNLELKHLLYMIGHASRGNVQWIHLHGVRRQDVAIQNLYAPHNNAYSS